MKPKHPLNLMLAALLCAATSQAAILNLTNYSFTPDGSGSTNTQTYDVNANNGGTIVKSGDSVAFFVTTFTFGTGTLADLRLNFATSGGADRLGINFTDNGVATVHGGGGTVQSYNFGSSVAGQTITIIGKFEYDANHSVTYGRSNASDDTIATFWINPTGSDTEGTGLPDGYAGVSNANFTGDVGGVPWNSSAFFLLEQTIINNSTPGTAGTSSITNTRLFTGTDATWANALAFATIPEPSALLLGAFGSVLLLRRRRD